MKNNYCVIMAGGVGSRFWPFSTEKKPKQFLDFFGTGRSLLQMTFDRFSKVVPKENIYIASNSSYKELIMEQLPEITENQVLLEPSRRNTAPCIAYAMNKIESINKDANVIVTPADHLIIKEDDFLNTIKVALNYTKDHNDILTLGIKPNRPETAYGYIQVDEPLEVENLYTVKTFTEKPNVELAEIFVESGEFYWNTGMFIWNVQTILSAFDDFMGEMSNKFRTGKCFYNTPEEQDFINRIYKSCTNISIDYAILEKASNVNILAADFGWTDLGTWGAIYDNSPKDVDANVTVKCKGLFFDSKDNVVALPEGKLAVIEGLEDYIVADSDNVLLICKKSEEHRIRQFVNETQVKVGKEYT